LRGIHPLNPGIGASPYNPLSSLVIIKLKYKFRKIRIKIGLPSALFPMDGVALLHPPYGKSVNVKVSFVLNKK